MFKEFGMTKEVFVNQDEGMFVAFPMTFDSDTLTLETESVGGRTYVKAGSVVKEGDSIRGITAERYDITDGATVGRVVLEGYAWTSRLTDGAIAAASSLPKIVLIPHEVGTAIEILSAKAILSDGREVECVNNALTLNIGDVMETFEVLLNVDVFLQGTPKSTVTIESTTADHGLITVSEEDRRVVIVTPIGTNGQIGVAGTIILKAPANAVKTGYGVGNDEITITLTVLEGGNS